MEWCTSTASTTGSLDGVAHQGLGDRRELMDSSGAWALSGVVGASRQTWQGRFASACSEDGSVEVREFVGPACKVQILFH